MIKQLEKHITEKQVYCIVDIIIKQYSNYKRLLDSPAFKSIFSDEYAPRNRQFSVSWAIASGFPSCSNSCEDFKIDCINYSKNFTRPLLYNNDIKILILNHAHLTVVRIYPISRSLIA